MTCQICWQAIQCSIATKHKSEFTADEICQFSSNTKGSLLTATVVSYCVTYQVIKEF